MYYILGRLEIICSSLNKRTITTLFTSSDGNPVELALKSKVYITYYDNEKGYPEWVDFDNPKTLGLNLIYAQLKQIDTEYTVGTDWKFRI